MTIDFREKAVLITGGATGIGLHIALAFARRGAACILADNDSAMDEDRVLQCFADAGAPEPFLAKINATQEESLEALLCKIRAQHENIEAFIHAGMQPARGIPSTLGSCNFEEYEKQDFLAEIEDRCWSIVEYTRGIKRVFENYPRYVVGLASTSALEYSPGADFTAASESAMEALCRYLNYHLFNEDVRINVLRYRNVSLNLSGASEIRQCLSPPHYSLPSEEVADAAVALCSGLMDCMSGHTLTVDRGTTFYDNLMRLYTEREHYRL